MKGYTHLKNKKRFPIQYKTETEDIKLNEVYKMYAFPKSLVEQCNSSALLFFQNMTKPIEYMKKISKMPKLDSVNELKDGEFLKEGLKEDEDYVYIRAFGQTEGRFYGAIKCEFDYLKRRYEFYDENLRDNKFGTACKCYFIDELNLLFGYQRFEVTEDKEKTVRNCIKQLNSLDDLRELKNSAYAKVKSY